MYPITYEADFNPTPNRGTTFFRILLAIPWLIVAIFWGILFYISHFISWIAIIILGRYPQALYTFNGGVVRFGVRVYGLGLPADRRVAPFGLKDDPAYPIRVGIPPTPPESQSRLKALFRLVLALPMLIVSYAVNYTHLWVAVISWLTIVFRGYQPEGINRLSPSSTASTRGSTATSPSSPTSTRRSASRQERPVAAPTGGGSRAPHRAGCIERR